MAAGEFDWTLESNSLVCIAGTTPPYERKDLGLSYSVAILLFVFLPHRMHGQPSNGDYEHEREDARV